MDMDQRSAGAFIAASAAAHGVLPVPRYVPSKRAVGARGFDPFLVAGLNEAHAKATQAVHDRSAILPADGEAFERTRAPRDIAHAATAIAADALHLWPRTQVLQRGPRPPPLDAVARPPGGGTSGLCPLQGFIIADNARRSRTGAPAL